MWTPLYVTAQHVTSAAVTFRQLTGGALIVGCVVMLSGAASYGFVRDPHGPLIFGQPPREWLRLVHEHARLWRWSTVLFIGGTLVTVLGQALLAALLRAAGDPGYAEVALVAFAMGAALWAINLAARLTVDPWAGAELARTNAIPESYTALTRMTGVLWVIYTILTFAGLSVLGGALLASHTLPGWVGWAAVVYGVVGLGLLAATRDAPPFLHYLMPLLMGILLLLV